MQIKILKEKKVRCEIDNDIVIATIMNVTLQATRCECMYALRTTKGLIINEIYSSKNMIVLI